MRYAICAASLARLAVFRGHTTLFNMDCQPAAGVLLPVDRCRDEIVEVLRGRG